MTANGLRSLYLMIREYGVEFYSIAEFLASLERQELSDEFFASNEEAQRTFGAMLREVSAACERIGSEQTHLLLDQLALEVVKADSIVQVFSKDTIKRLSQLMKNELNSASFKFLTKAQADLYNNKESFGPAVAKRFPASSTDIEEAGKCLALERPTACVFHLMRVMERAVQSFGKKLGIKLPDLKTWQKILDELNAPIKAMPEKTPAQKKRKELYLAVHANLFSVKFAWRNPVMHPKTSYSPEEAQEIFDAVRIFMGHLAELL